jgi:hypothetical protein
MTAHDHGNSVLTAICQSSLTVYHQSLKYSLRHRAAIFIGDVRGKAAAARNPAGWQNTMTANK